MAPVMGVASSIYITVARGHFVGNPMTSLCISMAGILLKEHVECLRYKYREVDAPCAMVTEEVSSPPLPTTVLRGHNSGVQALCYLDEDILLSGCVVLVSIF